MGFSANSRIAFDQTLRVVTRRRVIMLSIVVLALGVILQIWSMNRLAVSGDKITKIEEAKIGFARENQVLENKVAIGASLSYIQKMANNLGFNSGTSSRLKYIQDSNLASVK